MGSLVSSVADIFGMGPSSIQAEATRSAAQTAADAQLRAAQLGAQAAQFRPVGITTRYGTSQFQVSPEGYLTGAGYTISPELKAYQDQLQGLTQQQLQQGLLAPQQYAPLQTAATGLFNLGAGYLAQTPEQAAQEYMASQQALLAPSRERESALLANQLANTGRTGLAVAQGGGLLSANPEQAALANARAMQDLQLAAQAQQAGQQRASFGAGLFGQGAGLLGQYQQGQIGALSPFQTTLGLGGNIESMGQAPLDIGAQLGGRTATAGARAGEALFLGGLQAAKTLQPANQLSPLASGLSGLSQGPLSTAADAYLAKQIPQWWNQAGNWEQNQLLNYQYGAGNVFTPSGGGGSIPSEYSSFD
jgi:hypothetical protein